MPQSSDINIQITYGQFVKNNKTPEDAVVFNAFIMPYNLYKNDFKLNSIFENVADAIRDWIENPKNHERIQKIVMDTRYLLKKYDGSHDKSKNY